MRSVPPRRGPAVRTCRRVLRRGPPVQPAWRLARRSPPCKGTDTFFTSGGQASPRLCSRATHSRLTACLGRTGVLKEQEMIAPEPATSAGHLTGDLATAGSYPNGVAADAHNGGGPFKNRASRGCRRAVLEDLSGTHPRSSLQGREARFAVFEDLVTVEDGSAVWASGQVAAADHLWDGGYVHVEDGCGLSGGDPVGHAGTVTIATACRTCSSAGDVPSVDTRVSAVG